MRTWIALFSCAAVVAVALSCVLPAVAQEYRTAIAPMPTDRLTQLENELATLRSSIQRTSWNDGECVASGGCESGCCDECGGGGDCGCGGGGGCGVYGGFEFVWMKPYLRAQPEIGIDVFDGSAGVGGSLSFDHDFEITPRMWLGFKGQCGLGVRARYWQYDHSANGHLGASVWAGDTQFFEEEIAEVLDQIGITHDLEMQVFDIEATQDFDWCRSAITLGAGVRYARLQQNLRIEYGEPVSDPPQWSGIQYIYAECGSGFEGVGPTVSLDFRRRIGQSCFYVVGGLRESVLFVTTTKDMSLGGKLSCAKITGPVNWSTLTPETKKLVPSRNCRSECSTSAACDAARCCCTAVTKAKSGTVPGKHCSTRRISVCTASAPASPSLAKKP